MPNSWGVTPPSPAALVAVARDAFHTTAWLAHLTTYLYTGMWRAGGPAVDVLPWLLLPFALGLGALVAARARAEPREVERRGEPELQRREAAAKN